LDMLTNCADSEMKAHLISGFRAYLTVQ